MGHCHMSAQGVQGSTVPQARKQPRSNKLSRSYRLRQQSGIPAGLVINSEPKSEAIKDTEHHSQPLSTSNSLQRGKYVYDVFYCIWIAGLKVWSCFFWLDSSVEDVLWTDKYSPQHSSEIIGNSASVNKLQKWALNNELPYRLNDTLDLKISVCKIFCFLSVDFRWLKQWKLRADRDEKRKPDERKREENSNGMSWNLSHFNLSQESDF